MCSMELRGETLAPLGMPSQEVKSAIHGKILNISQGGICLLNNQSTPVSPLLRCEIMVPGTCAAIPTLMQVRWTQKDSASGGCKMGLQFLV